MTSPALISNSLRMKNYRRKLRRRARKAVAGLLPIECVSCGQTRKLEMAHVKPTGLCGEGRGYERRYLDALKHPTSYVLLCRPCHVAFDNPMPADVEDFG